LKDFEEWVKQMVKPPSDSLVAPIEDYVKCEPNCECPKVPDENGVMRNADADYAAGLSAGRWIREQQIVHVMRVRAAELNGSAKKEMLLLADQIEGGK
jgi:hypothetical protein